MPTRNTNDFIAERIASGEACNTSEVVRAELLGAINESANDSQTGNFTSIDSKQELQDFFDSIHEEVLAKIPSESKII